MSLINAQYFVGNLLIPNATEVSVAGTINFYINKYEKEFLVKLLGYQLYKAYEADPTEQRFKDIIEGVEFTEYNGNLAKWNGLVEVLVPEPTTPATTPIGQKQSIIANYVYFYYRKFNMTQFTGIGEVVTTASEGSIVVSPRRKIIAIWNEIHYIVSDFIAYLDMNQDKYPEWPVQDKYKTLDTFGFINPIY